MMETGRYEILINKAPLTATDDENLETGVKGRRWKGVVISSDNPTTPANITEGTAIDYSTKIDKLVSNTRKKEITVVFDYEDDEIKTFILMRPLLIFDMQDAQSIYSVKILSVQLIDSVKDDENNPPQYQLPQIFILPNIDSLISGANLVLLFLEDITKILFSKGRKKVYLEITYT